MYPIGLSFRDKIRTLHLYPKYNNEKYKILRHLLQILILTRLI